MKKRNDNQKVTSKSLRRDMQDCHAYLTHNDLYNDNKYRKEVAFLDAVLADDDAADWECQSEEDKRAREVTAKCLLVLVGRSGKEYAFQKQIHKIGIELAINYGCFRFRWLILWYGNTIMFFWFEE